MLFIKSSKDDQIKKDFKINDNSGFTLIEVLIAMAIFAIGFLAVGMMQVNALNKTTSARRTTEAMALAEDQAELLMAIPFYLDNNYNVDPNLVDTGGTHTPNPPDATPYTAHWTVTDNFPIPAYAGGVFTAGALPRSKTIRVWVTRDGDNEELAELEFAKFFKMDL